MFEIMDAEDQEAVIKVIGIGGCGGNAVDHMIQNGVQGVEFISANTDAFHLGFSRHAAERRKSYSPAEYHRGCLRDRAGVRSRSGGGERPVGRVRRSRGHPRIRRRGGDGARGRDRSV